MDIRKSLNQELDNLRFLLKSQHSQEKQTVNTLQTQLSSCKNISIYLQLRYLGLMSLKMEEYEDIMFMLSRETQQMEKEYNEYIGYLEHVYSELQNGELDPDQVSSEVKYLTSEIRGCQHINQGILNIKSEIVTRLSRELREIQYRYEYLERLEHLHEKDIERYIRHRSNFEPQPTVPQNDIPSRIMTPDECPAGIKVIKLGSLALDDPQEEIQKEDKREIRKSGIMRLIRQMSGKK